MNQKTKHELTTFLKNIPLKRINKNNADLFNKIRLKWKKY